MGGYEKLNPLWINLSCRLLRLVRLGWSQVCYTVIWRTGHAVVHQSSSPTSQTILPPPPLLCCFGLLFFGQIWSGREQPEMSGLRFFVKDGLCTWCHWKGKAEILWRYYKMAEPHTLHCINPHDCISKPIFLSDVRSHRINFQHNYLQLLFSSCLSLWQ